MDGVTQDFVALVADVNPVNLAGLEADRGRAGDTLQHLGALETMGRAADFAQQPRGQRLGGAGRRAKQVMIGMSLKERFDPLAVLIPLELQRVEQLGRTEGQQALGRADRMGSSALVLKVEFDKTCNSCGGNARISSKMAWAFVLII